jgi:hypothetical protein
VDDPGAEAGGQGVVEPKEGDDDVELGIDDEHRTAGLLTRRKRRLERQAGCIAHQYQPALDLLDGDVGPADQRRDHPLDAAADPLRHVGRVDPLDETLDDGQPKRRAVVERLRRNHDPDQDISGVIVRRLKVAGLAEDFGHRHAACQRCPCRCFRFGELRPAALDHDVGEGDEELIGPVGSSETGGARKDQRRDRTGR